MSLFSPSPSAGLQGSAAAEPALGKRKERPDDEAPPGEAAGDAAAATEEARRGSKRLATAAGPSAPPQADRTLEQAADKLTESSAKQAAAGVKRKPAAGGEEIEPRGAGPDASPPALPRAAVRPRWEQPAASGGGAAIGSPGPSPYRLLSPAKAGAASLNQLPGLQFSKGRRSSAASDISTAGSGSGSRATAAAAPSSSASGAQPLFRRKLAAPPSRLGGEPAAASLVVHAARWATSCKLPSRTRRLMHLSPHALLHILPTTCRHARQPGHARPPAAGGAPGAGGQPVRV